MITYMKKLINPTYRMKNIKKAITSRQLELGAQMLNASHSQEHGNRRAKSEEMRWPEIELGILDERLASTGQTVVEESYWIGATRIRHWNILFHLSLDLVTFASEYIILDFVYENLARS